MKNFVSLQANRNASMKKILIFLCGMVALTACQSDDATTPPALPAQRTVVVYMAAENDLSGYSNIDIEEMKVGRKAIQTSDNLVLFVDRAVESEKPYIAKINSEGTLEKLYEYPQDFLSSDPARMSEVLKRAIALCPATSDYGLVLWGHANGWVIENDSVESHSAQGPRRAYGRDTGDNTQDRMKGSWLNIPSLRMALQNVGIRWKFIFADCCNMAGVEVAYELRQQTDYLIASPAEIPGKGAPYQTMVKDFFIQNDQEMYQQIIEDYYAQLDDIGGHTPLTAVKTALTPELARVTRPLLPRVDAFLKGDKSTQGMIYYYAFDRREEREKTLYDMNDVMRTALGADDADYIQWKRLFDQAVYSKLSTKWFGQTIILSDFVTTQGGVNVFKHGNESYGGMSMFFPMEKYNHAAMSHQYNETTKKMAWYYAVGWSSIGW